MKVDMRPVILTIGGKDQTFRSIRAAAEHIVRNMNFKFAEPPAQSITRIASLIKCALNKKNGPNQIFGIPVRKG